MTDREFRGRFGGDDPPADTSNTIITEDSMEAIVAVSEGPIRGLVDGAKSFYIGDTPLQSPDGSLNYKNFTLGVFNGYGETITSAQGGFGSATAVSVEMLTNVPVTRVITTLGIDFIDIRMVVNRLYVEDRDSTPFASIANLHVEWRTREFDRLVSDGSWREQPPGGCPGLHRLQQLHFRSWPRRLLAEQHSTTKPRHGRLVQEQCQQRPLRYHC